MATTNIYLTLSESMFQNSATSTDTSVVGSASQTFGTTAANHPGAIEVLKFSFSVDHVGSQPPGQPRSVEGVTRTPLTIDRAVDSRSPKLFSYCCRATIIETAKLLVFGPRTDVPYLTYEMKGVHISKYAPSSDGNLPTETLDLTFDQMKVKFDNAGIGEAVHGNGRGGNVTYTWNWVMEVPGFTWMPTGNI